MPASDTCFCTLDAASVRADDSGEWRCEVQNKHGKSTATCNVKVIEEASPENETNKEKVPSFIETLQNMTADVKANADLVCKTNPDKFVSVKWFRNEVPIDESMDRYKTSSLKGIQQLSIIRAKPKDSGIFKCRIHNDVGWASCDAKLVIKETDEAIPKEKRRQEMDTKINELQREKSLVYIDNEADSLISNFADTATLKKFLIKWKRQNPDDLLKFAIHLKSRCVVEGCNTVMGCLITGERPYTVKWFRGTEELIEGGKYFINERNGMLSLTINRAKDMDTGNYTCTVRNIQGKISSSCYLQVEPSREVTCEVPTQPYFVTPLKKTTVNEGEDIWFKAKVNGYPSPGFKWYKDGLELHESDRVQIEVLHKRKVAQLVIANATTRDIGLYTCEAHNLAGRCQSMVRISVRDQFEEGLWRTSQANNNNAIGDNISNETDGVVNGDVSQPSPCSYTQKTESDLNDQVPVFKTQLPKSIKVDGRDRFMLEFYCGGYPLPNVQWYRNGNLLEPSKRLNLLSFGNWFGLEVLNPDPRDAGSYTVKAVNSTGRVASTCEIELELPTTKEIDLPQLLVETTDKLSMRAVRQVAGVSETEGDNFSIAEVVPSFHLCNTEADWTTNIDKEVEILDADEAPSFPHCLPENISPHEYDENIHLECQVRGEPIPKIAWLKDDKDLSEGDNISLNMDPKTRIASLVIKKATIEDSGKYSCVAFGESGGHAVTACNVHVLPFEMTVVDEECEVSTGKRSAPEFKVELRDKDLQEGADVKLECQAEGFPVPKVNWYKNDTPIKPTIGKYTITSSVEGTHSLIIAAVHVSDSDCYKCEAVNECGATNTHAHVVVHEQSETDGAMTDVPHFTTSLRSFTFNTGETAMLHCVAKGNPVPTITWRKDDTVLISEGRVDIDGTEGDSSVTIEGLKPEDAGLYICSAENDKGKVESSATLTCNDMEDETETSKKSTAADIKTIVEDTDTVDAPPGGDVDTAELKSANTSQALTTTITDSLSANVDNSLSVSRSSTRESSVDVTRSPKIVTQPLTQWLASGQPLKLKIEVSKSPDLVINWFHNDKPVDKERYAIAIEDSI